MSETEQRPMGEQMAGRGTMEAAQESTTDAAIVASAASVLLSWHQFFVRGNKELGIFIGLWPPTILAFASYFNQKRMEARMESMGPGKIMDSLGQMIGSR